MSLDDSESTALAVRRATATPLWKGFITLVKYRTLRNYRSAEFLGPRLGDKVIFALLISTIYWGVGDSLTPTSYLNVASMLFMWSILPACVAASSQPHLIYILLHTFICSTFFL
jgi:ATP-binding cassette, subfamily G (WHITE), member 2